MSKQVREWVHILLTASILLFVLSGIGITEFNLMNFISFGVLTKDRSYLIHSTLLYPFTVLLFIHIYYTILSRRPQNRKSDE